MATKRSSASLALFIALNILFFSLVSANGGCPPPATPTPKPTPSPPAPKPTPSPPANCPPSPKPTPTPSPPSKCPTDTLKLGVCAEVLGLVNVTVGAPPVKPCCALLKGLADLEAAACLCTAIKGNILGINLNVPVTLTLLLNVCSKKVPPGFQCP